MKLWSPDTCGCTIEEVYNGNEIVGGGVVVKKCTVHTNVPDNQLYDVLLNKENRPKNQVERFLLGMEGEDLGLHDITAEGSYVWKNGIGFNWSFLGEGSTRSLTISVFGKALTQQQRNRAQQWLDNKFGVGKVTLA
jgi:hypothetical protein